MDRCQTRLAFHSKESLQTPCRQGKVFRRGWVNKIRNKNSEYLMSVSYMLGTLLSMLASISSINPHLTPSGGY